MAAITLLGRDFDVAPYKLREMRQAAPLIGRINATVGALSTLDGAVEAMCDMAALVSIGIVKSDPTMTPEMLETQLGVEDMPDLQAAVTAILEASGLKPGEATAPSAPGPQGA